MTTRYSRGFAAAESRLMIKSPAYEAGICGSISKSGGKMLYLASQGGGAPDRALLSTQALKGG